MEDISECQSNVYKLVDKGFNVDLIVLSYNGLSVTKKFLDLLYSNTNFKDFHLIMIDNGSSDDTPDMLKGMCDKSDNFSLVLNSKNLGVIRGRNLGFFLSNKQANKSKHIMFLDNDQYVQKGWLENHLEVLDKGYDIVGVEAWQMNKRFMPLKNISDRREHFSYVGCGGMLMKRFVAETVGSFDTIFNPAYFEDPDYNFRCHLKGYNIAWNYKAKIVHFPHQTLGKVAHESKAKQFTNSLIKFRAKWKTMKLPIMRQKEL